MQQAGMDTENLEIQKVYVYLSQPLSGEQSAELEALGIVLYPDSWIPPVGQHDAGFLLAEMPVDQLEALAAKEFVINLDTAETKLSLQSVSPQNNLQ